MGRLGNDANVLKRRRIWRTRARRQVTRLAVTFTGAGEQLLDSLARRESSVITRFTAVRAVAHGWMPPYR